MRRIYIHRMPLCIAIVQTSGIIIWTSSGTFLHMLLSIPKSKALFQNIIYFLIKLVFKWLMHSDHSLLLLSFVGSFISPFSPNLNEVPHLQKRSIKIKKQEKRNKHTTPIKKSKMFQLSGILFPSKQHFFFFFTS